MAEVTLKERVLKLASEPSSFSGLAAAMGGMALLGLNEAMWTQIFGAVATVAGVIAMVTMDNSHKKEMAEAAKVAETKVEA